MSGFCRGMREEQNQGVKDCMLDYVINFLDDAQDFSWFSAKASHAVLLCRMEQGEIGGWFEVEKIDEVRRDHAQRHGNPQLVQNVKGLEKNHKFPAKFTPCVYFDKNACSQTKIMKTRAFFIDIFVLLVSSWMEKHMVIPNWTVGEPIQKKNKNGHAESWDLSCQKI